MGRDESGTESTVGMTHLSELFELSLFDEMFTNGYISCRPHPDYPLVVANYTDSATYDRVWNDVTRRCRGLIYNSETGEVVARPFEKFFNYDEPGAPQFRHDDIVEVFDKVDGSLGIIYPEPGGKLAVATRGSFTSEQALWATTFLRENYPDWRQSESFTDLVEIVYPENRIVLDYGSIEDLYYLCSIHIPSGESTVAPGRQWPGRIAESFGEMTFAEAMTLPPRNNAEGVVIRKGEDRVKMKQSDYILTHRVVFGLNARSVWEVLKDGGDLTSFIQELPEEFRWWASSCATELTEQYINWMAENAYEPFNDISDRLGQNYTRREFAEIAKTDPNPGPIFLALDGNAQKLREVAWKAVKPSHRWSPRELVDDE